MKCLSSVLGLIASLIVAVVALVLILNFTNPTSIGSVGVLLVFVNIYLITSIATLLCVRLFQLFYREFHPMRKNSLSDEKAHAAKRRIIAVTAILNFIPILLVSMASIRQLNLISIFLLFAFEAVAVFYVWRRF